jgi:hypothetical protein
LWSCACKSNEKIEIELPLDDARIADARVRYRCHVRWFFLWRRKKTKVHAVGNQNRVWIDTPFFFEQGRRVDDDLVDTAQQIHLARRVWRVPVGEGVFVVDVVTTEIVSNEIERI